MQLNPLSSSMSIQDQTWPQIIGKAFPKIMWLVILCRVLGYCVKNYYLINRQAVKRTTTYAWKHAAFSAELAATEMLKNTKNHDSSSREKYWNQCRECFGYEGRHFDGFSDTFCRTEVLYMFSVLEQTYYSIGRLEGGNLFLTFDKSDLHVAW